MPDDPPLSPRDLDALDGVLTGCAAAIAETGTVVLDGGARSGRRLLTLVPDLHVCVVEAADVHDGVPDAIAALAGAAAEGRPLTLVSGPSATSDIELERVEGVHGPAHARDPRRGAVSRAALLLALALAALPAAASAAVPPALGPDGRVYPLLGGGAEAPRDGLPATQLRVGLLLGAAALADGSVAVLPFREEPFAVAPDGRVATLPEPPGEPEEISALVGAPDGALLALRRGGVLRLGPDAGRLGGAAAAGGDPGVVRARHAPAAAGRLRARRPPHDVARGRRHRRARRATLRTCSRRRRRPTARSCSPSAPATACSRSRPARPRASCARRPAGTSGSGCCRCPRGDLLGVRANSFAVDVLAGGSTVEASLRPEYGLGTGDGGPFEAQGDLPAAIAPDGAVLLPGGADNPVRLAVPPRDHAHARRRRARDLRRPAPG